MTQSKPSIYRQMLALLGQIQIRQESIERKLDQIKLDVTYLKSRALVIDEGNAPKEEVGSVNTKAGS